MTSKIPVRSAEDIDATALSYAEIKALATGNPLIIEKAQLESDVNKLKLLHASHLNQKYALEDKILKEYPLSIKWQTERIAGYKADMETAARHPSNKDNFPPMTIGGILYAEKAEAGKALIEACKSMTSPEPVPIGEYNSEYIEMWREAIKLQKDFPIIAKLTESVITEPVTMSPEEANKTAVPPAVLCHTVSFRDFICFMLYTVAMALDVSPKTGYKLLRDKKIVCLKIGRAYRIPKAHILTYLMIGTHTILQ